MVWRYIPKMVVVHGAHVYGLLSLVFMLFSLRDGALRYSHNAQKFLTVD
jgi:hypothetical protein